MGITFCPQERRFSAAILTDYKGKQRSMRAKRHLGGAQCLWQYRIILSADTASEVRQMLSQKRR